jgi:hypothetical protein
MMKQIKLITMIVALVCLAASCKKEPVTYRFAEEDKLKLLPHYIEGKIFTFANENGEERKFKVEGIEQDISQYWESGGMMGGDKYYFFCEYKQFELVDLSNQNHFVSGMYSFPVDENKSKENIYKHFPSHLLGKFGRSSSFLLYHFTIDFIFNQPVQTFNFNGIIYNNVIVIYNEEAENSDGGMLIDAKVVYYDIYQGIIGFDDINNHEWRLKNSK